MLKAIKIRLYPDKAQEQEMNKLLGSCRFVYNYCLGQKINAYKLDKASLSMGDLNKKVIVLKNTEEYLWLKDAHSKVVQQSLLNLDLAYKNFFREKKGFPKFKSKRNGDSCRFPVDAISGVKGNRFNLTTKLKNILFKCSARDEKILNKSQTDIKSATLSKTKSGNFMLSVLIDKKQSTSLSSTTDKMVGIDIGIKDFIVDSNGRSFENIKTNRNNKLKLAKLQRQISKKANGSKNRDKTRIFLAKFNSKLTNKKQYYLHSIVNELLNENQVIAIEDLNVKGMMSNHKLAKSIQELSIGEFFRILKYKADWQNKTIFTVNRWFASSKICSNCGYKNKNLKLSDREWICPHCGAKHSRDHNAAKNILNEAIKDLNTQIGLSKPELTLVESSSMDDPTRNGVLKSTCSSKQEGKTVKFANEFIPNNIFHCLLRNSNTIS